ncbi:hypothetical protein ACFQFC_01385 [Amorphoplanes digitatis]|uniref:Uncharacterized protein n=1 Tax=Actinoplanes digitatis TaxID=1868 RepID=A0A7W7MQW3_9ACTN|nr:hypothetical protein [Actinoplanes digitatis]MBB4762829.1 hypothetical protein [Actinoplanes digitatis]BFE71758.1 hypothetical protein GCM10020092_050590 [Actinoplanes digitatis]GID91675.1 hypothetical protein Adi01nite_10870 [Actinoplanes digitatis]
MDPVTLTGRIVAVRQFCGGDATDSFANVGDDQFTRWRSFDSRNLVIARAMLDGASAIRQPDGRDR